MSEIGERIKKIRESLGTNGKKMSQSEFAKNIGIGATAIGNLEAGIRNPSERTILDICRVYNVNEAWLRDGIGEMFAPRTTTEELTDFFADIIHEDSFRRRLVTVLSRIPPDEWKVIEKYALQLLEECKENPPDK